MGKGTIISGGTDGQYQVSVIYNTDRPAAEKAANLARIADIVTAIAAAEDTATINSLTLQKLSIEKRNETLDAIPETLDTAAWCADLTEDLTGDVGLIEVPGESVAFNIQPGHNGNAAYSAARDGQLTPTMAMTPAAAFYNLAMLPGWQKWKPTFRYGTISAISGDTASVTLAAATSTQQALGVNQESTLTGVPVEYMTCNGAAFEVGDEVLVKFAGQDWAVPVIVGFKDNPAACGFIFTLTRGDGVTVDSSNLSYISIRNATGSNVNHTRTYEAGAWHIILDPTDPDSDSEGFYVWYKCADGLETLYPGKYKDSEGVNDAVPPIGSLITQGEYSDTIPYWKVSSYEYPESISWNGIGNRCSLGDEGNVLRASSSFLIPPTLTATIRKQVKSSVPYRIVRHFSDNQDVSGYNVSDFFEAPHDTSTIVDGVAHICYPGSGPVCSSSSKWQDFGTDRTPYASAQVVGGGATLSVVPHNEYDFQDFEEWVAAITGRDHDITIQDTTSPDSITVLCPSGSSLTAVFKAINITFGNRFTITPQYDY